MLGVIGVLGHAVCRFCLREPLAHALVLGPVRLLAGHAAVARALAARAHLEVVAHCLAESTGVLNPAEVLLHEI